MELRWILGSGAGRRGPAPLCKTNFRLNGVPLRRVSQAYVIATSTKVELGSISIPESVNDAYFAKSKAAKGSKEGEFFGEGKEKKAFPEEKKSEQKVRWACLSSGRSGASRRGEGEQGGGAYCAALNEPLPLLARYALCPIARIRSRQNLC